MDNAGGLPGDRAESEFYWNPIVRLRRPGAMFPTDSLFPLGSPQQREDVTSVGSAQPEYRVSEESVAHAQGT
jgi:hypothetical protein